MFKQTQKWQAEVRERRKFTGQIGDGKAILLDLQLI